MVFLGPVHSHASLVWWTGLAQDMIRLVQPI